MKNRPGEIEEEREKSDNIVISALPQPPPLTDTKKEREIGEERGKEEDEMTRRMLMMLTAMVAGRCGTGCGVEGQLFSNLNKIRTRYKIRQKKKEL